MMRLKTLKTLFSLHTYFHATNNAGNSLSCNAWSIIKPSSTITLKAVRGYIPSTTSHFTRPDIRNGLYMESLPCYGLPKEAIEIESGGNISMELQEKLTKWSSNKLFMRANECDYIESFRMMINFEEAAQQIQHEKCNQEDVRLQHVDGNEYFFFVEPKMKDLCTHIDQFDRFDLRSKDGFTTLRGEIILKEDDKIYVELYDDTTHLHGDQLYDIVFRFNRTVYLLQHQALDFVQRHNLFQLLINNPHYAMSHVNDEFINNDTELESSTLEGLNEEQVDAVKSIVAGKYYPLPYLLYGPPGTGKTKTLVAAIENIVRTSNKNILVCAQSNAACDEITNRLRTVLDRNEMFRLYAKSIDSEVITASIKIFSNLFGIAEELKYPPLKYVYKYRVVICTLAVAGCITRAQGNPDHFSYVIIDECASSLETMTLVPIAGLCTSENKVHANIVLAGDPKQLDAVTKSEWATKLGFGTSWLEQLFHFPIYKRDPTTRKFNPKYITQLVKNYRSHPAILHVPNQLFYDGVLEAKASPNINELNIQLPQLNPYFPVIFKSVQGLCVKPENNTSSYNVEEMVEVMSFIRILLKNDSYLKQSDIGIVSPYRLQSDMLRIVCKSKGFKDVTVGTAETFQGQERKIIIASTVCSGMDSLGSFVSDPQRLNVMATRAQYLLIIVGDPHTLDKNDNWSAFIRYCHANGNLIQSNIHFTPEEMCENIES